LTLDRLALYREAANDPGGERNESRHRVFSGLVALDREEPRDAALTHCTGGTISLPEGGACAVHVLTS